MSDTHPLLVSTTFLDSTNGDTLTLLVDPAKPMFDGLTVVHADCDTGATVSVDLDAFYCPTCRRRGRISGAWATDVYDGARAEQHLGRAWSTGGKWFDQALDVIVTIENWPHPAHCTDWDDEDGCDCGIEATLSRLYALVGAETTPGLDHGRVDDDHPLVVARGRHFDAWRAEQHGHDALDVITTHPSAYRFGHRIGYAIGRPIARLLFGPRP